MKDLSMFDLSGKAALVTGGAIGLGRACAEALAAAGANVAIVDVNDDLGNRTADEIRRTHGVDSVFVTCDVSDKEQVSQMTDRVVRQFGRLDIGINNAGFGIALGGAENLDENAWNRVLGVNLTGVLLCAQAQARHMIRQTPIGGKIVNTASIYGSIAGGNCSYNAAKAGVIHLTRSLAVEWGRFNINVNCVSPSWVMTANNLLMTSESMRARMREVTPLGHIQRPEDLRGAIIYLSSRASDFVTGHNLIVDGGHTLNTWLTPLERANAPRVSPDEEIFETLKDLQFMGVPYNPKSIEDA